MDESRFGLRVRAAGRCRPSKYEVTSGTAPEWRSVAYAAARGERRGALVAPRAADGVCLREIGQHGGDVAAEEEVLGLPLFLGLELFEELHFAAAEHGYGYAVAVEETVSAQTR